MDFSHDCSYPIQSADQFVHYLEVYNVELCHMIMIYNYIIIAHSNINVC